MRSEVNTTLVRYAGWCGIRLVGSNILFLCDQRSSEIYKICDWKYYVSGLVHRQIVPQGLCRIRECSVTLSSSSKSAGDANCGQKCCTWGGASIICTVKTFWRQSFFKWRTSNWRICASLFLAKSHLDSSFIKANFPSLQPTRNVWKPCFVFPWSQCAPRCIHGALLPTIAMFFWASFW